MKRKFMAFAGTICGLLALQLPGGVFAQPTIFNPATVPQRAHAPTPYGMATLSTAMIECPTVGATIAAIAHSDPDKTYLYVELGDGISTVGPIEVAGAGSHAVDVALADDPVFPGYIYRVAVTYKQPGVNNTVQQWVKQFEIKLDPNVPYIAVQFQERLLLGYAPIGLTNLRIDAVPASPGPLVGGVTPLVDKFMILYSDPNGALMVRMVNSNNIIFATPPNYGPYPGYTGRDIAASVDISTNEVIANIAANPLVPTPLGNLAYIKVNMSTLTASAPVPLSPDSVYNPRIEAFGFHDPAAPTPGPAQWTMAAQYGHQAIMLYTDKSNNGYWCNPSQYNPGNGTTQEYPTVAAGIGPVFGGNIGNEQYSYAWGDVSKGRYLAQALDFNGDPINPNEANEVNNTYCTMLSDPSDIISMSNSCNTGYGTLVAWNEGRKIFYKLLDNTYRFKPAQPTGTGLVKSLPAFEIFPNPAKDYVTIKNTESISQLIIMNSMGIQVFNGHFASEQATVSISHLAAGMYQVSIVDRNGKSKQQKLIVAR